MRLLTRRVRSLKNIFENPHSDLNTVVVHRQQGKALKHKLEMANEREVAQTMALFHDSLSRETVDGSMEQQDDAYGTIFDMDGDLGVEYFSKHSPETLYSILGFPHGRPIHWCHWKLATPGTSFWDQEDGEIAKAPVAPLNASPLTLLWHQAAGVASMARRCFTEEPSATHLPGILLADAVGVGKTAQVMGFIAFVQSVWMAEQGLGLRPPVVGELIEYVVAAGH